MMAKRVPIDTYCEKKIPTLQSPLVFVLTKSVIYSPQSPSKMTLHLTSEISLFSTRMFAQAVCMGSQVLQMVVNFSRACFSHLPLQFFFLILTSQKFPKFLPKTSQKSPKNDFENPNPQKLPKFKPFQGRLRPQKQLQQKAICHRVNPLILKRAISHILPQLPFYLLFCFAARPFFFLIFSCFFLINSW